MKILEVRSSIYDQFHGSDCGLLYFTQPENADDYAAFYTSMYLIQDTGEAVSAHMEAGFSKDPMRAYIEFWGVMQATVVQQDAICELYKAILGVGARIPAEGAWRVIRRTRDLCVGHPANRSRGVPAAQRTFMGRMFGDYERIQYELWDAKSRETTHPAFNLRELINSYDDEASHVLSSILGHMKAQWPARPS